MATLTSVTIQTINEDQIYTYTFATLKANANESADVTVFKITALVNGTLKIGTRVITAADVSAGVWYSSTGVSIAGAGFLSGSLTWTPQANYYGTEAAFQIKGATAINGTLSGSNINVNLTMLSVNDAPTGTDKTITILEDASYTFTAADFGFLDTLDKDSFGVGANTLLNVKITSLPTTGSIKYSGVAVTLGQLIQASNISSLKFTPAANAAGTAAASFTFQVQDNGGTANGGIDLDQTPNTITFNITPINDAPTGADKTITILEDNTYTFSASDFGFSDSVDNPNSNALLGVFITVLPAAGSLKLSNVAVTAGQFIALASIPNLKFTPAVNAYDTSAYTSISFKVKDNGGTTNGGQDVSINPNTITFNVTPVNDAPNGTDKTVTILEDAPYKYTFSASDFGFNDNNENPYGPDNFMNLKITTLPTSGILMYYGTAVTVSKIIPASGLLNLKYFPAANFNGSVSFTFQVQDTGGTANGGVDLDPTPNTMTINVTSVNDMPSGTSKTITLNEDVIHTFTAADFGFTDPDGNSLATVKIDTRPTYGVLKLSGVVINTTTIVSAAIIPNLTFVPKANYSGTADNFTFRVQDNGGTLNGGVDLDSTAKKISFTILSSNDAPSGSDKTISISEDYVYTFTYNDFAISDIELHSLSAVKITTLPTQGILKLYGNTVTLGQMIAANNIPGLTFTPSANANGTVYGKFTFQVKDSGGTANGGIDLDPTPNTITFNVTPVNDAPLGSVVITGTAAQGEILVASNNLSDADGLGLITYTWLADGIAVATGNTLTLTQAHVGRVISVVASYTDATGHAEAVSSAASSPVIDAINDAPSSISFSNLINFIAENSAIPTDLKVADLTIVDDTLGSNVLSLSGADAASFVLSGNSLYLKAGTDLNYEVKSSFTVELIATDDALGASTAVTYTLTVGDVNEAPLGSVNITGNAAQGEILVASNDLSDPDGIGSITYTWLADGIAVATGNALTLTQSHVGKAIVAVASYTDVNGHAESVSSTATSPVLDAINDLPSSISFSNLIAVIPENSLVAVDLKVADLTVIDDTLGSNILSLSGADAANFILVGNSLYLKAGTDLNYEVKSSFTVQLVATDVDLGASMAVSYTLNVSDVNEAPLGSVTIAGTAAQGETLLASNDLSDPDGAGTISYTWLADGIPVATGSALTLTQAHVGKALSVVASYTDANGHAESVSSAATSPVIDAINDGPSSISFSNLISVIAENSLVTTDLKVADLSIIDDTLGSNTLSLSGADAASFVLVGSSLYLKAGTDLNYEVKSSFTVQLVATDASLGASTAVTYLLNVSDVNESPLGSVTITGTAMQGETLAASNNLVDPDGMGLVTYTWLADGIAVATGDSLFLTQPHVGKVMSVRATYVDAQGHPESLTSEPTLLVTDSINDAPSAVNFANSLLSIDENTVLASDLKVADLSISDDNLGLNELSLTGDDADLFTLVGNALYFKSGVSLDFESQSSYTVNVVATDASLGASVSNTFILNVNDINEAPTEISLSNVTDSLDENTVLAENLKIADVSVLDDALGTKILSLSGADSSAFILIDNALYLKASVQLDYETKASYSVNVTATEIELGASVTTSFVLTVNNINDAPIGIVTISGTASQGQNLTASNNLTDQDGIGSISYTWFADGAEIAQGESLILGEAQVGKTIVVTASYIDGHDTTEAVTSLATAAVANVNDASTGSVSISGDAIQSQLLTASNNLADIDGLGSISYQWKADGQDISGATSNILVLGEAQVGKAISITASYIDGHGATEAVTSLATAEVANVNDAPTGSISISGIVIQGETLTASNNLADIDGLGSISYQWKADGQDISGATSNILVLSESQVGKAISITASYIDGHGITETVSSSVTAPVANVNDAPTGSISISGLLNQGETLSVSNTLADIDGLGSITYAWFADGAEIAQGESLTLGESLVGKIITVNASYTDGHGTAETVSSSVTAVVANVNDAPTGSVSLSGVATQGETLTASNSLADIDGLGNISYTWFADGANIGTGESLTLTEAQVGKGISISASYTDGHGAAEAISSSVTAPVANVNDAPTGSISISGLLNQGETLSVSNTLADIDGLGTIGYQWKADGVAIDGAISESLVLDETHVGKVISVLASYTDGHGTGETVTSTATTSVANINDAPVGGVTITGATTQGQTLTASNNLSDLDGLGTISYSWTDSLNQVLGSGPSLILGEAHVGKVIKVTATYTDGHGSFESVVSTATSAVANINDSPTGELTIVGTMAQGQILTASHNLSDIDGLGTIAYIWTDNLNNTLGTGTSLTLTESHVGRIITLTATYIDGHGAEENVSSVASEAVANVNDAGALTILGTVAQNQTLSAQLTDLDGLGTVSYAWTDAEGILLGTESTLALTEAHVGKSITVTASYTDGHGTLEVLTQSTSAAVANVNDAPTTISLSSSTVAENVVAAVIGNISVMDPDLGDSFTFTVNDNRFEVINGQLKLKASQALNFETESSINLSVTATDAGGLSTTQDFTISVSNVNDAPTGSVTISGIFAEGKTLTAISTLADEDGMSAISYQWKADGVAISGATSSTWLLTASQVGKQISVTESYVDGLGNTYSVDALPTDQIAKLITSQEDQWIQPAYLGQGTYSLVGGTTDVNGTSQLTILGKGVLSLSSYYGYGYVMFTPADDNFYGSLSCQYVITNGQSSTVQTLLLEISPVNDAPSAADSTLQIVQGSSHIFAAADFSFNDSIDNPNPNTLKSVIISWGWDTYQNHGTLKLNDNDLDIGMYGAIVDVKDLSSLVYTPKYNFLGGDSINFRVTDSGGLSSIYNNVLTFNVVHGNYAPSGTVTLSSASDYIEGAWLTASDDLMDRDGKGQVSYQWLRDGVQIGQGNTYQLVANDLGHGIAVTASYLDNLDHQESVSSIVIRPHTAIPHKSLEIHGEAVQGGQLTSIVTEADPSANSYQWLRDGIEISGATADSYTMTANDVGHRMSLAMSYSVNGVTEYIHSVDSNLVNPINAINYTFSCNEDSQVYESLQGNYSLVGLTPTTTTDYSSTFSIPQGTINFYTYVAQIEFIPKKDFAGSFSLQYGVTDNDGITKIGGTVTFNVTPVNDAPSGTDKTITTLEDIDYNFTAADFGFSDVLDGNSLLNVKITTIPAAGSLMLSGAAVTAGQLITVASITNLVFTPAANANGTGYASFAFQVQDNGGTANGGVDLDQSPNTITINVTPVYDPATLRLDGAALQGSSLTANIQLNDALSVDTITSYEWSRNGVVINGAVSPNYTLSEIDVGSVISAKAYFADGQYLQVQSQPVVNVNDPVIGGVTIHGDAVQHETLTASHTLSDLDGLGEIHYQWLRNGLEILGATGNSYILTQNDVGSAINVRAKYQDGHGTQESVLATATSPIANFDDQPIGGITISGLPTQGEELTASCHFTDEDGLGVLVYQWLRDGQPINEATGTHYTLTEQDVGHAISFKASYFDGQRSINSVSSAELTIANVNDAPSGEFAISGDARPGAILEAHNTLSDADGLGAFTYIWLRNGEVIALETGSTYTLAHDDIGQLISARITYIDGHGQTESLTSNAMKVNGPATGNFAIEGVVREGETLTLTNTLQDPEGISGSFIYQWFRDEIIIDGANTTVYQLSQNDVDHDISAQVSYVDGSGKTESLMADTYRSVLNVNSPATGGVTIVGDRVQGGTLSLLSTLVDEDNDENSGSLTYQWLRNGVNIPGATASTYTLLDNDVGMNISVNVVYTDARGERQNLSSGAGDSTTITNVNDLPIGSISIERSGDALPGQVLNVINTLTDVDGLGSFTYTWSRDGQAIAGANSSSYALTAEDINESSPRALSVSIQYVDGHGHVETLSPNPILARSNQAPSGSVTITAVNGVLQAANQLQDPDGMGLVSYQWMSNGIAIENARGETYTLTEADTGSISVLASYIDGQGTHEQVESAADSAANLGGGANHNHQHTGTLSLVGMSRQGEVLSLKNQLIDLDGLGALSYQWQRDGVNIVNAVNDWYELTNDDVGHKLKAQVSYIDASGHLESDASNESQSIANKNDAPSGSVQITGTVKEGCVLTASHDLVDPDSPNGIANLRYNWFRDDQLISGASGTNYTLTEKDAGHHIRVSATYQDGGQTRETSYSEYTVAVENINNLPTGFVTISGIGKEGEILTAHVEGWEDADGMGLLSYVWLRDGVGISDTLGIYTDTENRPFGQDPNYLRIIGVSESSNVYKLKETDVSHSISVRVSYRNDALDPNFVYRYGDPTPEIISNSIDNIENTNNQHTGDIHLGVKGWSNSYSQANQYVNQNDTLSVFEASNVTYSEKYTYWKIYDDQNLHYTNNYSHWAKDGQPINVSFQWYRDGVAIHGANSGGYRIQESDSGHAIKASINYTINGINKNITTSDYNAGLQLDTDINLDVILDAHHINLRVNWAKEEAGLSDLDGLGTARSYQWLRDGQQISSATNSTYKATEDDVNHQISVQMTYVDGHGTTEVSMSNATMVKNVNDTPTGSVTISGEAKYGEVLTAHADIQDIDGVGEIKYRWFSGGGERSEAGNGDTYELKQEDIGKNIFCLAEYLDGHTKLESIKSSVTSSVIYSKPIFVMDVKHNFVRSDEFEWKYVTIIEGDLFDVKSLISWPDDSQSVHFLAAPAMTQRGGEKIYLNIEEQKLGTSYIEGVYNKESINNGSMLKHWNNNYGFYEGSWGDWSVGRNSVIFHYINGDNFIANYAEHYLFSATPTDSPQSGYIYIESNGDAYEGSTLTINTGNTRNDDREDGSFMLYFSTHPSDNLFTYKWYRDGQEIANETNITYVLKNEDAGKNISASAKNLGGYWSADFTNEIFNLNDLPTGAITVEGDLIIGAELHVGNHVADLDGLGAFTYQWQWSWHGDWWEDLSTGDNLTLTEDLEGKSIRVIGRYTDVHGTLEEVVSARTGLVGAEPNHPATGTVTITGTMQAGATLSASNNLVDADGILVNQLIDGPLYGHIAPSEMFYNYGRINDGKNGKVLYQWLRDEADIVGASGEKYELTDNDVGSVITVRASFTDAHGNAEIVVSENSSPVTEPTSPNTSGNLTVNVSGESSQGSTLTASDTISEDSSIQNTQHQWTKDGIAIPGATENTYTLTAADAGHSIGVITSYTDAQGNEVVIAPTNSPAPVAVTNVNDTATGDVIVSGRMVIGSKLMASNTLDDADGLGDIHYQWLRDGQALNGSTGSTYTLTSADIGHSITVKASFTDAMGAAESLESESYQEVESYSNVAVEGSILIEGKPAQGHILKAKASLFDENGLGQLHYQWLRDGINISGATKAGYLLTHDDLGHQISVRVSFTDGDGNAESVISGATPQIGNDGEFQVNTSTSADQSNAVITSFSDNSYLIVWQSAAQDGSGLGIYAQRYSATGNKLGAEFRANSSTSSDQASPAVSKLAGNGFVITWQSSAQDDSGKGVYGQLYAADGAVVGSEFKVNTTTLLDQSNPSVSSLASGFIVTWESTAQDSSGKGIYAQLYTADGATSGLEFKINSTTLGDQSNASVSAFASGGFIVTWESNDGSGKGIYAQRFAADSSLIGSEFLVNSTTINQQQNASVTSLANGSFVILWQSLDASWNGSIRGKVYAANGDVQGSEFQVNSSFAGEEFNPAVTALNGGFLITWESGGRDGSDKGIYAQRYDANGASFGSAFLVNSFTEGSQSLSSVTALANGGFVITWQSSGQDGSGNGIFAKHFNALGEPVAFLNTFNGAAQSTMNGTDVNGVFLNIGSGDTATGASGEDRFVISAADFVSISGGAGQDTLVLDSNLDLTHSGTISKVSGIEVIDMNGGSHMLKLGAGSSGLMIQGDSSNILLLENFANIATATTQLVDGINYQVYQGGLLVQVGIQVQGSDLVSFATNSHGALTHQSGDLSQPLATLLKDGGYLMSWKSEEGLVSQRYDLAGEKAGEETVVAANDMAQNIQTSILADGGYISVWQTESQGWESTYTISAQRFSAAGAKVGDLIQVNSFIGSPVSTPAIATLSNGSFAITWQAQDRDGEGSGIYAQVFDALGVKAGAEFKVNSFTHGDQRGAQISAQINGGFVVTWTSADQDGSGDGIYAQRFTATGAKTGSEFKINTSSAGDQSDASLAVLSGGNFVVTWTSADQDGSGSGIYAQRFSAAGGKLGGEFLISATTDGDQFAAKVTALSNGGFVTTWESGAVGSEKLMAKIFDAAGKGGAEFQVSAQVSGDLDIAALANSGFLISWKGDEAINSGLFSQRYDSLGREVTVNHFVGTAAAETLKAPSLAGNRVSFDFIPGISSGDTAEGGDGDDSFAVSTSDFTKINGGAGTDTLVLTQYLDLTLIDNSKLSSIEVIDLKNYKLTLAADDILALTDARDSKSSDASALRILGDGSSQLDLTSMSSAGSMTIDGVAFTIYHHSSDTKVDLLVQTGINII